MFLAANWFFDPLVNAMGGAVIALHHVIPNYGWALIALAAIVRIVLWPLSDMQFRSMAEMQKIQPLVKDLQKRYKGDAQKLQQATMELYREHKVNPFAGCLPLVIQLPILFSLFWAIQAQQDVFKGEHWLWIGSAISVQNPKIFATSLAAPDIALLALYVISMYFTVRYGSPPSTDPQQAQTQRIMAFVSPAMIAYFGFRYQWASALYIYWLATNVFTVGQQLLMYRKYGLWGGKGTRTTAGAAALETADAKGELPAKASGNGAARTAKNGSKYQSRAKKRSRR